MCVVCGSGVDAAMSVCALKQYKYLHTKFRDNIKVLKNLYIFSVCLRKYTYICTCV